MRPIKSEARALQRYLHSNSTKCLMNVYQKLCSNQVKKSILSGLTFRQQRDLDAYPISSASVRGQFDK